MWDVVSIINHHNWDKLIKLQYWKSDNEIDQYKSEKSKNYIKEKLYRED